ncbi:S8 family serine peptidase [Nonomuraea rubra]
MTTLDARLRHLLARAREQAGIEGTALAERVGWQPGPQTEPPEGPVEGTVEVLVSGGDRRWLDDVPDVTVHTFQPDLQLYAVRVPVARLEELAAHESVRRVESSRPLFPELNISRRDVRAAVQAPNGSGPLKGEGTIVAIIDSGIDYTHPAFRHPGGSSRILHLWDQSAAATPGGSVPYGVEYAKEDLDKALGDPRPTDIVPHEDTAGGHGTHVAGIAAGDDTQLGGVYQGIAPHADLIVVALAGEPGGTLGRSTQLVAAVDYAVRRAEGRPVAVNLSLGMNGGGHSGESLVERALDAYARRPGVVIVKSAGNERERRTHAGGTLGQGEVVALDLVVPPGDVEDDLVEVWFDGEDRISVAVTPPSGSQSAFTGPGEQQTFTTRRGDRVTIDSEFDASASGDTATTVIISGPAGQGAEPGVWRLLLRGGPVRLGRYDAWIERAPRGEGGQSRFSAASADPARTVTAPGTARRLVTVGSYATRPADWSLGHGALSSFSSLGPTRLGEPKPDLTAPGETIASARCAGSALPPQPDLLHTLMAGTSMAAPHVCGAAALVMAARAMSGLGQLTGEQTGQLLRRAARPVAAQEQDAPVRARDVAGALGGAEGRQGVSGGAGGQGASGGAHGPELPEVAGGAASGHAWGAGKLDVARAVESAATAVFPRVVNPRAEGATLVWETDADCSWRVRCHTVPARLAIGKHVAERAGTGFGREHRADLSGLPPGRYHCEILVTDRSGLWTRDDNGGPGHVVPVEGAKAAPVPAEDDFQRVKGVGPKISALLHQAGITTFEQLRALSVEELAAILHSAGIGAERLAKQDWIGQAAALAAEERRAVPERHTFTLTVTADSGTREVLNCEIRHHQTDDVSRVRGWDAERLLAFIGERARLRSR